MTNLEISLAIACTILVLLFMYAGYCLVMALNKNRALSDELMDLHAHITALEREVKTLTPKRDAKGLFMRKPKHDSANDPVVIEMRRG